MKEKSQAPPLLAALVSQHQEQEALSHTDWRQQGKRSNARSTNAAELPSESAEGNA